MGKLFKVLIWGKNSVGKTSLIEQLAYGRVEDKVRIYLSKFFSCL
jgi:GTPase SAR1 family protein